MLKIGFFSIDEVQKRIIFSFAHCILVSLAIIEINHNKLSRLQKSSRIHIVHSSVGTNKLQVAPFKALSGFPWLEPPGNNISFWVEGNVEMALSIKFENHETMKRIHQLLKAKYLSKTCLFPRLISKFSLVCTASLHFNETWNNVENAFEI